MWKEIQSCHSISQVWKPFSTKKSWNWREKSWLTASGRHISWPSGPVIPKSIIRCDCWTRHTQRETDTSCQIQQTSTKKTMTEPTSMCTYWFLHNVLSTELASTTTNHHYTQLKISWDKTMNKLLSLICFSDIIFKHFTSMYCIHQFWKQQCQEGQNHFYLEGEGGGEEGAGNWCLY